MNFFETELKKMTAKVSLLKNIKLVGRACIARLTDTTTVKIMFCTQGCASQYSAIHITVLNRTEGKIDEFTIKLLDVWGMHQNLYAWSDRGETRWAGYYPTGSDYTKMAQAISDYLENFAD